MNRNTGRLVSLLLGLLLCLGLLPAAPAHAAGDVAINETNFPDANFRKYVSKSFDVDNDGKLSKSEIAAVTEIDCSFEQIASVQGVEFFPALKKLWCGDNQLTALDVSLNTALTELFCYDNQLTALDVSKNSALVKFSCEENQLAALDLSNNPALTQLFCNDNQLAALDLSKNPALYVLWCYNNRLTALDLSRNPALFELRCAKNQLTEVYAHADAPLPRVSKDEGVELIRVTPSERVPGDANGDGALNGKDLTRLCRFLAGYAVEIDEAGADVNGDGVVNGKDLTRLCRYLAGYAVELK